MAPPIKALPLGSGNTADLSSPSKEPQYNKKTGRPIRRGAGTVKPLAGYVDSAIIEEEVSAHLAWSSSEADDNDVDDGDDDDLDLAKRSRKRKRSPSPSPPPLEPIIYDPPSTPPTEDDMQHASPLQTPTTLQFNVPIGFHGPLIVKLNAASLNQTQEGLSRACQPRQLPRAVPTLSSPPERARRIERTHGFCDLPPELRNKVYRHLFVTGQDIFFPTTVVGNLCRSGQFLRTCRLVYSEGCSVLYGENTFGFDRNRTTRGPFWEPVPKEIGYKDVRQFLMVIGPENLAYLRDVKLILEDANPAATPYLASHEDRRYLNDEHLMACLQILRNAKLRKINLNFFGRRTLLATDTKFLGCLAQIKADEVVQADRQWICPNKVSFAVWERLKNQMTRKTRLYKID